MCHLDRTRTQYIGWGTFPGTVPSIEDGIVIETGFFGTAASGRTPLFQGYTKGHTLTHEVGHWLNLRHNWGDDNGACTGDDGVTDTPSQSDATFRNGPPGGGYYSNQYTSGYGLKNYCPCDFSPCANPYSCGNYQNGRGDMYMNFMDITNERCQYMFTAGQVVRMRATLTLDPQSQFSRASILSSLGGVPLQVTLDSNLTGTTLCSGNRTNYNFHATPSGGCGGPMPVFQWTIPTGWTITKEYSFFPSIIPDGIHGGTVSVTVSYTDGTNTVTLPTASVTINVVPTPYAAPTFTSGGDMCAGQTQNFDISPDPIALNYRWYVPAGFSVSGAVLPAAGFVTTSGPTLALLAPMTLAAGSYTVTGEAVYVQNTNKNSGCPTSPAASRTFNVINPVIVDVDPLQRDGNGQVCQNRRIRLGLQPSTGISNITWSISAGYPLTGVNNSTADFRTDNNTSNTGTSFTVTATYRDNCGNNRTVNYAATTTNATTLLNGYNCPTAPQRPYPNPADKSFRLEGFSGSCVMYNSQGQPVGRYTLSGGETGKTIDAHMLPNGFYAVVGQDADGSPLRYTVQVQH